MMKYRWRDYLAEFSVFIIIGLTFSAACKIIYDSSHSHLTRAFIVGMLLIAIIFMLRATFLGDLYAKYRVKRLTRKFRGKSKSVTDKNIPAVVFDHEKDIDRKNGAAPILWLLVCLIFMAVPVVVELYSHIIPHALKVLLFYLFGGPAAIIYYILILKGLFYKKALCVFMAQFFIIYLCGLKNIKAKNVVPIKFLVKFMVFGVACVSSLCIIFIQSIAPKYKQVSQSEFGNRVQTPDQPITPNTAPSEKQDPAPSGDKK